MAGVCPHCGSSLPLIVDAFCPACHNSLDESPATPAAPRQQQATREAGTSSALRVFGWLMLIAAVLSPVLRPGLGGILSAAVFLLTGAALLGDAARRSARARRLEREETSGGGEGRPMSR